MRIFSFQDKHLTYLQVALIASYASYQAGFRQRDFKFFLDLFLNWVETPFFNGNQQVHNTQILRFLEHLGKEGYLRKTKSRSSEFPIFKLSRTGLIEVVRALNEKTKYENMPEFFFIIYFLNFYKEKLLQLVKDEGKDFPVPLRIELENLLDTKLIIKRHLRHIEQFLLGLNERIIDNQQATILANNMHKAGKSNDEIIDKIQTKHPYKLNSQKPLKKLLNEIPVDLRNREMTTGGEARNSFIWEPTRSLYKSYYKILSDMV